MMCEKCKNTTNSNNIRGFKVKKCINCNENKPFGFLSNLGICSECSEKKGICSECGEPIK